MLTYSVGTIAQDAAAAPRPISLRLALLLLGGVNAALWSGIALSLGLV